LNIERFRGFQTTEPQVKAPKVYWGFERSDLLVMEYLQGEPILAALDRPPREREALVHLLLRNYLKQVFVDNYFHADPHPGNILLLGEHTIGYLDFGAMGRLDRPTRRHMQQLFHAVVGGDVDEAARVLVQLGQADAAPVDRETLPLDVERLIQLCRVQGGLRWTDEIIETARRHGIRLPQSMIALTKGLVLIESLALQLDREVNLRQELEALSQEVAVEGLKERVSIDLPELLESYDTLLQELPALLRRWLREHAQADLQEPRWLFSRRKGVERV
jgi:ubiquinone biosynthesis protein